MADIREAVPAAMQTFWDMTISAYWAWSCWDAREGQFHSAQGAGGLGFGFPGGHRRRRRPGNHRQAGGSARVLAVSGDGSAMYSIAELATARQHNVPVTWLIVDDGGYGILREYMVGAFGKATATELARPDFVKLAEAFGVPATRVAPEDVGDRPEGGLRRGRPERRRRRNPAQDVRARLTSVTDTPPLATGARPAAPAAGPRLALRRVTLRRHPKGLVSQSNQFAI